MSGWRWWWWQEGDTYGTMTVIGGRLSHRRLVRKIDAIMAGLVDRRNQDAILLQLPLLQNQTKNQSKSQSPPRFFFFISYLYLVFLVYHHPPKPKAIINRNIKAQNKIQVNRYKAVYTQFRYLMFHTTYITCC